jgi:hypothetical protein
MAGQLIKRKDRTWLVRIFLGRDANGKRIYINRTVCGGKKLPRPSGLKWNPTSTRDVS